MKLRRLVLERKIMTNLDSILKSRDQKKNKKQKNKKPTNQQKTQNKKQRHYFPNKDLSSQSSGFSSGHVWMWELDYKESWALKNWCFELWCWRRLLRVPWTARRSNQSILKEIRPEYSLEGLMLKLNSNTLATWYEELTHLKRPWCWKRLKAKGDDRGWDGWMASLTQWTWVWVNYRSWWWTGRPGMLQSTGSQLVGHDWATELNWTGSCLAWGDPALGSHVNGDIKEGLWQGSPSLTAAASARIAEVSPCWPISPQETLQHL